jgi:hypothetical protein
VLPFLLMAQPAASLEPARDQGISCFACREMDKTVPLPQPLPGDDIALKPQSTWGTRGMGAGKPLATGMPFGRTSFGKSAAVCSRQQASTTIGGCCCLTCYWLKWR